jgi:hypothetical protein
MGPPAMTSGCCASLSAERAGTFASRRRATLTSRFRRPRRGSKVAAALRLVGDESAGAHELRQIGLIRHEGALAQHTRVGVEQVVDSLEAKARHPNKVSVWIGEANAQLPPGVFSNRPDLFAQPPLDGAPQTGTHGGAFRGRGVGPCTRRVTREEETNADERSCEGMVSLERRHPCLLRLRPALSASEGNEGGRSVPLSERMMQGGREWPPSSVGRSRSAGGGRSNTAARPSLPSWHRSVVECGTSIEEQSHAAHPGVAGSPAEMEHRAAHAAR